MKKYYTKSLSEKYADRRKDITSTDKEVFSHLSEIGIKGKTILDFGCGDGAYVDLFLNKSAKEVTGVDTSSQMIALAQKNHKNIEFIKVNSHKLPFENNTFDIVFSNFVFHHIKNLDKSLREIFRILKSGGVLIATTSSYDFEDEKLKDTVIPITLRVKDGEVSISNFIKHYKDIKKDVANAGFKIKVFKNIKNKDSYISSDYTHKDRVKKKTSFVIAGK